MKPRLKTLANRFASVHSLFIDHKKVDIVSLSVFKEIEGNDKDQIIKQVNPLLDFAPFQYEKTRALRQDLPFYPDYAYIELTDNQQKPARQIGFIQKDDTVVLLDWSNKPLYALNETVPIVLNRDTILYYVRFFFNVVRGQEGRFFIVDSAEHVPWQDDPSPSARRAIGKMIDPLSLIKIDENGDFICEASIVFKQSLFESKIIVSKTGDVRMSDQDLVIEDIPVAENL